MSSVLPAPPSPKSRETTISYLSRLAASKGVSAREYASDMGVSLKRVINQEDEALKRMAYWGRLSTEQLADQVSWAGSPAGEVRLNFRGELYGTRSLRNPVVRGCPHCLREDMANCANAPAAAMAMRGDWQFRESILCVRHKQPLVPLWRSQPLIERNDFTLHFPAVAEALANGRIVQQLCKPLPYDTWLDRRLSSGQDDTWLSSLTVYAVSTVCLLLGMKLRSLSTSEVNDDWRRRHAALSAGFEIVSRGEDGVRNALDRLALEANKGRDTPKAAFGQLYGKLSIDFVKDPAFTVFRTILRDCILDHWEYAGTEVVLGEPVGRRHFHSLLSASKETGFSPRVLNNYLVEAGVLDANDPRPEPRRLFDAIKYADLLKTLPALVEPIEMQSAMGATRRELRALHRDGVLKPHISNDSVRSIWKIEDGLALIAELRARVTVSGVPDEGWETINLAAKRKKVGVNAVIDAIRAGTVTVGVKEDQRGYSAIRILMTSVDHWHARHGKEAKPEGAMSVAEFARSIGQHNNRYFLKLFETGHASAMSVMHPVTRRKQRRMTDQQIAAFREKFATTGTLHSELGLSKRIILDTIRAAGIQEFSSDGQNFGQVWLRKDVIHLFASED